MRRSLRFPLIAVLLLTLPALDGSAQTASRAHLTLEDLFASRKFVGAYFDGGRWAEEGPVLLYTEGEGGGDEIVRYNLQSDERELVLDGARLTAADVGRTIAIEDYAFSPSGDKVLLYTDSAPVWRENTKGYYYIFDEASGTLTPLGDRSLGYQMFAKFSPDGKAVGFVRDRDLYVKDLTSGTEQRLTTGGAPGGIINGTTDWVYEEEFGLRDGWAWSPDGRYIAFVQLDESGTRDFMMADLRGQYPEVSSFRYPKAGETNSDIRVGVVGRNGGEPRFFDTGTWRGGSDSLEYIPRFGWTPEGDGSASVWMIRLDRDQNDLDLLYGDPQSMRVRRILEEHEPTWIDVESGFSDLDVGKLNFLDDNKHFVWVSEAGGYRHLYLYTNEGARVRQITSGQWDVTDFYGVDEKSGMVYFSGTLTSPLERHLYRIRLNAKPGAAPEKITEKPGWHDVNFSADLRYYIDTFSDANTPPVVTLHKADGEELKVLESNEDLIRRMATYDLPSAEFISIPGADGTSLNAQVIRSASFDSTIAHPVLMAVYGGPGSQEVRNQWYRWDRMLWHRYLAEEHGYVVVVVDPRGTAGRGKAFKSVQYKRLGIPEAEDMIAAARWLGARSWADADRIGIWGWSYGGYMTLLSMLYDGGPQVFDTGVAVAPVTDWRLYDSIYTERYLSTPQLNPDGYRLGSPIQYADRLASDQSLLIIHGDMDDNVHFQNTLQMVDALQAEGKQFDMMVYPGRNHGIYGGRTRLHLFTFITDYILENL